MAEGLCSLWNMLYESMLDAFSVKDRSPDFGWGIFLMLQFEKIIRGVAQSGRVLHLGCRSLRFKS